MRRRVPMTSVARPGAVKTGRLVQRMHDVELVQHGTALQRILDKSMRPKLIVLCLPFPSGVSVLWLICNHLQDTWAVCKYFLSWNPVAEQP